MNLEIRDEILTAGSAAFIGGYGRQFLMMDSSYPVDIIFLDSQKNKLGEAKNLPAGLSVPFEKPVAFAVITSAVNQVVKVGFSDEIANFNRITGTITAVAQQAALITNTAVTVGVTLVPVLPVDTGRRGVVYAVDKDTISGRIAIGGVGVTFANASIILSDESPAYIDTHSAASARYAIAEVAGQVLRVEVAT